MWIRLTLRDGNPIMVNMDTYGNFMHDSKNPAGSILYQTDAQDDSGILVMESFEQIVAEIERQRRMEQ